ncbi:hypothetical protein SAMN06265377_2525 [Flagellimonas pacifica]|uniref:Uncharacterized protein n=2 Tax=Flagellimonas pacifica TaxID=1247520 RepID=A0A285MU22_9FLAO|nr:hypothetical protein SAMN06265377_2525 [Allomuricauda parva]
MHCSLPSHNILAALTRSSNLKHPSIMKKVFSIIALAVLTLGMFSCEAETDVKETEALMAELGDQDSSTGSSSQSDDRN